VTTMAAGMADPNWPTVPWYLLQVPWTQLSLGTLVEHSHRTAGYVIGLAVLVLALGLSLRAPRTRASWWAVAGQAVMVAALGTVFAVRGPRPPRGELPRVNAPLLAGCIAACVGICLAAVVLSLRQALRRRDDGSWLRCLGMLALGGVICQGLLGGV